MFIADILVGGGSALLFGPMAAEEKEYFWDVKRFTEHTKCIIMSRVVEKNFEVVLPMTFHQIYGAHNMNVFIQRTAG